MRELLLIVLVSSLTALATAFLTTRLLLWTEWQKVRLFWMLPPGRLQPRMKCDISVTGQFHGRDVSLTWSNGEITGDPDVVCRLRERAAAAEGELIAWPNTRGCHLEDPVSAMILIHQLLRIDNTPDRAGR